MNEEMKKPILPQKQGGRDMRRTLLVLIGLILSVPTFAQEKEKSPLEITGRIFANFSYDLTKNPNDPDNPDSNRNKKGFDVDRSYFQANYKFDDSWSST